MLVKKGMALPDESLKFGCMEKLFELNLCRSSCTSIKKNRVF